MSFMIRKKIKGEIPEEHTEKGYFINFISEPPTLQHIVAVSIASRLWSEPDIKEDIKQYSENFGFDYRTEEAEKIYNEYEKKVLKKLADMSMPDTLQRKVSEIFPPIGLQLFKAFAKENEEYYVYGQTDHHEDKGYCRFYHIGKIGGSVYWTMEGIIDNATSLKEVLSNGNQKMDFDCLFEFATNYCLEEYIPSIWSNISSDIKDDLDYAHRSYDYHIAAYWTASMENNLINLLDMLKQTDVFNMYDNNLSIEQNMVSLSIFVKNPYALKYFWNKLKEQERHVHLEKWLSLAVRKYSQRERHEYQNCNDRTNILCFLLSQLKDKNHQKEVFQAHSGIILKDLLYDWPWQRFFLPTFCIMLDYVSEEVFVAIMSLISMNLKEGNEILIEVFREIWIKSPLKLKKLLVQSLEDFSTLIYRFIDVDDIETIYMILKYATEEENEQILFNMIENHELFTTIRARKLSLIDTLITKYLTSSFDIENFKQCVMSRYGSDLCEDWICKNDFQSVETLFAWAFKSATEVKNFKKKVLDKFKIYKSLVCLGDFEIVDSFMHWYFKSEYGINKFKKAFIHEVYEDNSSICAHLLLELCVRDHGWECFEKFVNYTFSSSEEEAEFKNMCLDSVTSFLICYRFDFAQKFVNWCLGSEDEVYRFKNSFVTSERGVEFIVSSVNKGYPLFYHPNELIKWFSISRESAIELKSKLDDIKLFSDDSCKSVASYKRWAMLYILDKYAGAEHKEDSDSTEEESDITIEIMNAYGDRH